MPDQCEMIVGFLVPHRCDNPSLGKCMKCGRLFCDEHVTVTPQGLMCLACQQGLDQPVAIPMTAQDYTAQDLAIFAAASAWEHDDDDDKGGKFSDLS
jgi:hypothetical protein